MSFNSNSYRRNQYRRKALENLTQAREIKARVKTGEAYEWEAPRIATFAKLARLDWRLYLLAKGMSK